MSDFQKNLLLPLVHRLFVLPSNIGIDGKVSTVGPIIRSVVLMGAKSYQDGKR